MATNCPQCSLENPEQSVFCARCGARLIHNNDPANGGPSPFFTKPPEPMMQQNFPSPVSYQQMPQQPAPPASMSYQQMQPPTMYTPLNPPQPAIPLATQLGKHALAGYGAPVSHASWLIAEQQAQAAAMLTAVRDTLTQLGLPGMSINQARLTERSFQLESRDYLSAHRGSASVFVYIAPAGGDLYISRTTTVKTPISMVRAAILTLLLILMIIGLAQSGSAPSLTAGFSLGTAISIILITFSFPLLVFFLVLIVASLLAWLLRGDAGMYLRPALMNDFQVDDTALIEETVDNNLRSAAKTVGIDEKTITVPKHGYRVKRRIRAI